MNRTAFLVSVFPLLAGLAWLLYPLSSDTFEINHGPSAAAIYSDTVQVRRGAEPRPNIVVLLADDLGQTDISLYGSPYVQTPHIDRLGQEGVVFTEGYITSPICSPSRAGLLTGRYQQRFGFEFQPHDIYLTNRLQYYGFRWFVDSYPWSPIYMDAVPDKVDRRDQGLPPTELTLAELLKPYGYATACIGKWHLGHKDFALPHRRGFDLHYGFYNSHSLFAPEGSPGIVDQHVAEDWTDSYIWGSQRNGPSAIVRNGEVLQEKEYLTDRLAEEAVRFIRQNQDQPFFLYVPFNAPHTPLQAPEALYRQFDHIDDPYRRIYQAMILSLDKAVGAIVDEVDRLGLAENTLIFFLSDNGGATYTLTTDNAPFKGGKITNFEGGIRVPFLLRWSGHISPGMRYDDPVSALDIVTTAAAASGARLPGDRVYDGTDLLPLLRDSIPTPPERALFWQMGFAKAVRQGPWKLLINDYQQDTLLYHLKRDPYERENLCGSRQDIVQRLTGAHAAWANELAEPLWPGMIYFTYEDETGTYLFED